MPSVLIEAGFLTNKTEGQYLNSSKGQKKFPHQFQKQYLILSTLIAILLIYLIPLNLIIKVNSLKVQISAT